MLISLAFLALVDLTYSIISHQLPPESLGTNTPSNSTLPSPNPTLHPRVWPFQRPDVPFPIDEKKIPDYTRIKYAIPDPSQPWRLWDTRQWKIKKQASTYPQANEFQIKRHLGEGGQGIVYEVLWNDQNIYAAKASRHLEGEIDIMRYIDDSLTPSDHTNILSMHYAVFLDFPKYNLVLSEFLIFEYCSRGTTLDVVRQRFEPRSQYTEPMLADILRQIAMGLNALHAISVYHLDLKPSNILMMDDPVGPRSHILIKIADFGHATGDRRGNGRSGTRGYEAPGK